MNIMRQAAYPSLGAFRQHPGRTAGLGIGLLLGLALPAMAGAIETATTAKDISSKPELRAFTDLQGHSFQAQVLSLAGSTVRFRRHDGSNYEAPLTSFNKADQIYITETTLQQHVAHGDVIFTFSAQPQTTSTYSAPIAGGTQLKWRESYKVILKNQTLQTLLGLEMRTIVFEVLLVPDTSGNVESPILLFGQTHDLDPILVGDETTFQTDALDMQQILANAGGYFPTAPAAHAKTDKLLALWARVYDNSNHLVAEWCSDPALMKQQSWDGAWAMATGQARDAGPARGTPSARSGTAPSRPAPSAPSRGPRGS